MIPPAMHDGVGESEDCAAMDLHSPLAVGLGSPNTGRLLLGHEEEPRLRVLHHAVCCSLAILVVGLARLLLLGRLRYACRGILVALGVLQKKVALEHEE